MNTNNASKLKLLIKSIPKGSVCLAAWLETIGISRDLQKIYKKSGWLKSIGTGAFINQDDVVNWQGGIYAIQKQAELHIIPGARTALELQGMAHYLRSEEGQVYLFSQPKTILPRWFKNFAWGAEILFYRSAFLPNNVGIAWYEAKNFSIQISSAERAILECLYLSPNSLDLVECYQIMEGLVNLRPEMLQTLLEQCKSVKVTRLFLYMAEKANHAWFKYLDSIKFDVGTGDRSIVKNGTYIPKYKIVMPKELAEL